MNTEQFYKYFKQQNVIPLNNILDLETNMGTYSNERVEGPLDYPITDEELEAAINKPEGKQISRFRSIESQKLPRYHFAFCTRQALYINSQQSTVRLQSSKRNFES